MYRSTCCCVSQKTPVSSSTVSARDGAEITNESAATHSAWFRMFMATFLLVRRLRWLSSCRLCCPARETTGLKETARETGRHPLELPGLLDAAVALKHEADARIRIGTE